jgi:hypothetical protein
VERAQAREGLADESCVEKKAGHGLGALERGGW